MRIKPSLIHRARKTSPHVHKLLRACKTIEQAQRELKWIKTELPSKQWTKAIEDRSRLVPLQYILGSQPFGSLEIRCRKNVLIPRWETEEWCLKLISSIKYNQNVKRVLDVCTGSGCIPLLIGNEVPQLHIDAIDISKDALSLSNENKHNNMVKNVNFFHHNVFEKIQTQYDLITSNPPYIPERDYPAMEKSVQMYEPSLALIGDLEFYKALIENIVIPSGANAFVFELGYVEQYEFTRSLLSTEWECYLYKDSAEKPRCVVAYRDGVEVQI